MVRMLEMYWQDSKDAEFKFLHVFSRIEKCEKWAEVRVNLGKGKEPFNPDAPGSAASDGRPEGNKKAKAARASAPATERLHTSNEKCIADAKTHAVKREEKCEARWLQMMEKQDVKIELLKTKVAAKKRNTDLAFLMSADPATIMDGKVKAWYMSQRDLILNEIPAPTPTPTPPPTPTPTPPPTMTPTPPTEGSTTKTTPSTGTTPASSPPIAAPSTDSSVVVQVEDDEPAI